MRSVHVLRKPCSEPTVAANVLRHGTGAVNVDACRVSFASEADEAESKAKNQHADFGTAPLTGNVVYGDYPKVPVTNYNPPGRWPANLILQHLDGCEHVGTKEVRVVGCTDKTQHIYEGGFLGGVRTSMANYASKGRETVAAWTCAPGCPVAGLDEQSGDLSSQVSQTGGASRFFKQVKP